MSRYAFHAILIKYKLHFFRVLAHLTSSLSFFFPLLNNRLEECNVIFTRLFLVRELYVSYIFHVLAPHNMGRPKREAKKKKRKKKNEIIIRGSSHHVSRLIADTFECVLVSPRIVTIRSIVRGHFLPPNERPTALYLFRGPRRLQRRDLSPRPQVLQRSNTSSGTKKKL